MKKMTSAEMRSVNGGKYLCTTPVRKKIGYCYKTVQCGHVGLTKATMGYHFLIAHGSGSGCTYRVI